jgi:hypothetical protein
MHVSLPLRLIFGFLSAVALKNVLQLSSDGDDFDAMVVHAVWALASVIILIGGCRHWAWVSRRTFAWFIPANLILELGSWAINHQFSDAGFLYWSYICTGLIVWGALAHPSVGRYFEGRGN